MPLPVETASGSYHYSDVSIQPRTNRPAVTHFEILRRTVPYVNCLEEGIVAVVEGAPIRVELVGELFDLAKVI